MVQFGVGQPVPRTEDNRLVIGNGSYTDDITEPNQAHAYMLRSPMAHAKITSIDTSDAKAAPGVIAVYTGADIEAAGIGLVPCLVAVLPNRDGSKMQLPPRPLLQKDFVRYVGDSVAMVVAETPNQAKDAAELIFVDYEELPAISDTEAAAAPDAVKAWTDGPSNVCFDWEFGDEAKAEEVFQSAAHVTKLRLVNNRVVVNSMEPRAAAATYDAATDRYTLTLGSQGVHRMRQQICQQILNIPEEKLRVVTKDVGGGFGMKGFMFPEYPLVVWAAQKTGRPVKWTGERSDAFLTDTQGRDQVTNAELALDEGGKILAVRMETIASVGAYGSQFGPAIPTLAAVGMHAGVYNVPVQYNHVRCVLTNTTPVDAYRGAGRPEASYIIERLVDTAAKELGLTPDELRKRNFVRPDQMPYDSPSGVNFDSGEFERNLIDAYQKADVSGFDARQKQRRAHGQLSGLGVSYYVERTGGSNIEYAQIEINPDETVVVWIGTQSTGQGHETAFAQVVADKLGIPFASITVRSGDTSKLGKGTGTGGSRSAYLGSGAATEASNDAIEKGKSIASNELEAAAADIVYGDGAFSIAGTDRSIGLFDVARIAATQAQGDDIQALVGDGVYEQEGNTYPNGCHICEVVIDPETGVTSIDRYTAVDDFGTVVNPLLLAGQVHGGIVQGLGQAIGENTVYDGSGQLLSGTFMDYWMPRADDFPIFDFSYNEVPCTKNPFGIKGCGEAGTVGALGAYVNAVVDALKDRDITHIDMPITPEKIWNVLHS